MKIFGNDTNSLNDLKAIFTASEIAQQPSTWLNTIELVKSMKDELASFVSQVTSQADYDIILTGAGTSEFVGNSTYAYLNLFLKNYKVKSYATTDLVSSPLNFLDPNKKTLLISYGRSGNSPESVGAVNVADAVCGQNVYHLFITCNHEGALSKLAQNHPNALAINLEQRTCDKSFAMTSSYTNMYLATLLVFHLNDLDSFVSDVNTIVANANKLIESDYVEVENVVKTYDFKRIVYLGANALKGVAQESALKMLELTQGAVVTMHDTPLGFRHGPKSIIDNDTLVVLYLSDDEYSYQYELDLAKEISGQRKGNKLMLVSGIARDEIKDLADYYYTLNNPKPLNNVLLGLDYIIVAQLLALNKSLKVNISPDDPCPSGEVNRVVTGVTLYPFQRKEVL